MLRVEESVPLGLQGYYGFFDLCYALAQNDMWLDDKLFDKLEFLCGKGPPLVAVGLCISYSAEII